MSAVLIVLLVLLLVGVLPVYPHSAQWGYGPTSAVSIIVVVLLVLWLTGRL